MAQPRLPRWMPGESHRVNESVVLTLVKASMETAKPTATTSSPPVLARLVRPRFRSRNTLMPSSTRPTTPARKMAAMQMRPRRVNTMPDTSDTPQATTAEMTMATPPMVGVPALVMWPLRPVLPDGLADASPLEGDDQEPGADEGDRQGDAGGDEEADHAPLPERRPLLGDHDPVVEGRDDPAAVLGGLMALSRHQHDVAELRQGQRPADGDPTVGLDQKVGGPAGVHTIESLLHGIDDGRRRLPTGIVSRDHDHVGPAGGHLTHGRSLGGVAVTSAPEDHDHPARLTRRTPGLTRAPAAAVSSSSSPSGVWA